MKSLQLIKERIEKKSPAYWVVSSIFTGLYFYVLFLALTIVGWGYLS